MSDPQLAMARDVIDRLDLQGDERVLDAGCGTGRVTALVVDRVPDGHVIAVDGSEAMVAETRKRFGDAVTAFAVRPGRARARRAGRRDPLDRDLPLDPRPRAALRPPVRGAASPAAASPPSAAARGTSPTSRPRSTPSTIPRCAAGPDRGTTPRPRTPPSGSQAAGFKDIWTWLQPWPVEPPDPREYFTTVILGSHLERLPQEDRAPFVDAVLAAHGRAGDRELRAAEHPRPSLDRRARRLGA